MRASMSGASVAGPSVAMILVRRSWECIRTLARQSRYVSTPWSDAKTVCENLVVFEHDVIELCTYIRKTTFVDEQFDLGADTFCRGSTKACTKNPRIHRWRQI